MRKCLVLLFCPFMTGCFAYCYPSVTQTPSIIVNEPDVTAFRVMENGSFFGFLTLPTGVCQIEQLAEGPAEIPACRDFHFMYGYFVFPISSYNLHHQSVRLYRRGYETITIDARCMITSFPWETVNSVVWKKAENLEAREKAILAIHQPYDFVEFNRERNEFIAAEYLALAESPLAAGSEHAEARERLRENANSFLPAK